MLTVELSEFMMQLKEGAINNVGPSQKSGTVKLYDVGETDARAFGDERVKLVFQDDTENIVEIAVPPAQLETLLDEIDAVRRSGSVEGFTAESDGSD